MKSPPPQLPKTEAVIYEIVLVRRSSKHKKLTRCLKPLSDAKNLKNSKNLKDLKDSINSKVRSNLSEFLLKDE